jgi:parallel beta-helix repeat protein
VKAGFDAIYIRADGSIDPPTASILTADNVTYVLNGSIYGSIVAEKNNTVIDGSGYTLQGDQYYPNGIELDGTSNITIKNMNITNYYYGIVLEDSSNSIISGNTVTDSFCGVFLDHSSFNDTISGNTITFLWRDIWLNSSSNNVVSGNDITPSQGWGVTLDDSSNNTIRANNITGEYAVRLEHSSNNTISANNMRQYDGYGGIYLIDSSNNSVTENDIRDYSYGVTISSSSKNDIRENNITENYCSVQVATSNDNNIIGNSITSSNWYSIFLDSSSTNNISGNSVTSSNLYGIVLDSFSYGNSITANNVTASRSYGIVLAFSSYNYIYRNNFVNNSLQVLSVASTNYWDDGTRGNYWSNYNGTDANHDGIGDTPYVIDSDNIDHYPLMGASRSVAPIWASPLGVGVIIAAIAVAASLSFLMFRRKKPSDLNPSDTTMPKDLLVSRTKKSEKSVCLTVAMRRKYCGLNNLDRFVIPFSEPFTVS